MGEVVRMNKTLNLQDAFLNVVRKENIMVAVYLVNGFQLRGLVRGFDSYCVVIESEGRQQLVYKHAISTISPFQPVHFYNAPEKEVEEV